MQVRPNKNRSPSSEFGVGVTTRSQGHKNGLYIWMLGPRVPHRTRQDSPGFKRGTGSGTFGLKGQSSLEILKPVPAVFLVPYQDLGNGTGTGTRENGNGDGAEWERAAAPVRLRERNGNGNGTTQATRRRKRSQPATPGN